MSLARLELPIISSVTSTDVVQRNGFRQRFDFNEARDDFEQRALQLDALGFALGGATGTETRMRFERSMRFRSTCSRVTLDGIVLLIDHHHRRSLEARDVQIKDGIVPGFAADDAQDIFGADGQRNGIFESSVHDGGNVPGHAGAARCILAAILTDVCGDYGYLFSTANLLRSPAARISPIPEGSVGYRGHCVNI